MSIDCTIVWKGNLQVSMKGGMVVNFEGKRKCICCFLPSPVSSQLCSTKSWENCVMKMSEALTGARCK